MGFQPLRQKRLEYVAAHRIEAGDEAHAHHESKGFDLGNFVEDTFYPKAEKRSELPNYLVKLEEKDEEHKPWYFKQGKVTWLEKAMQRDFAIGASTGALIGTVAALATVGAAAPLIGAMSLAGGMVGGASDYIRNHEEMENGALITPPTHFNRDAIKYSLGWALAAKFALTIGSVALTAIGVPVLIPELIMGACMAAGALYGAKKGADAGYERMEEEYKAATIKHQRPELGVSVQKEIVRGGDDLGLAAGVAIATGIAANQSQITGQIIGQTMGQAVGQTVNQVATAAIGSAAVGSAAIGSAQAISSPQIDETTKWREAYQPKTATSTIESFNRNSAGNHADMVATKSMATNGVESFRRKNPTGSYGDMVKQQEPSFAGIGN